MNSLENDIDGCTASIQDLNDAMKQLHWDIFDKAHERIGNLTNQLQNIRDLLSADEDTFFDDEGNWSENGVAVLGTYVQELELYKSALNDVNNELKAFNKPYEGNEAWFKENFSIDSEEEYYEMLQKLRDEQAEYLKQINDTEQSVVGMYEQQIDAIQEWSDKLVDSYNDYIDLVKEALDAERDLYDFKRKIEDQSKDLKETERKIASLSGSTDAADIAERRRLQATLLDQQRDIEDSYRERSWQSKEDALDKEAQAYADAQEAYIEGLRNTLDEAKLNMDLFMEQVVASVMLNAGTIKTEYENTGLAIDNALTDPWDKAAEAMKGYEEDALSMMNQWTTEEGFFGKFETNATDQLSSPWQAGIDAAKDFQDSIESVMGAVYTSVNSNVTKAKGELNSLKNLYSEIQDTTLRAPSGGNNGGNNNGNNTETGSEVKELQKFLNQYWNTYVLEATGKTQLAVDGLYGPATTATVKAVQETVGCRSRDGLYDRDTAEAIYHFYSAEARRMKNYPSSVAEYKRRREAIPPALYAKGTMGTDRDQWAITDEPWLGDELTMYATKQGTLSYMRAGSTVVPADLTKELVKIGEVGLNGLQNMPNFNRGVNIVSNAINKPEIKLDIENFLRCDNVSNDSLPELKKFVNDQMNSLIRQLNYGLKKAGAH